MTAQNISSLVRDARRALNMTQRSLAGEMGVSQPAISAFERGRQDALSTDNVERLVRFLELDLASTDTQTKTSETDSPLAYCPNCDCPAAILFVIDQRVQVKPLFYQISEHSKPCCRYCQEPLERNLNCDHELVNGVFCGDCRVALVADVPEVCNGVSDVRMLRQICREQNDLQRMVFGSPIVDQTSKQVATTTKDEGVQARHIAANETVQRGR
jgi:transcriptional regulator with XRE-family HTH domain